MKDHSKISGPREETQNKKRKVFEINTGIQERNPLKICQNDVPNSNIRNIRDESIKYRCQQEKVGK